MSPWLGGPEATIYTLLKTAGVLDLACHKENFVG